MCDYCDCRSVPLIDALGEDHGVLLSMADGVERDLLAHDPADARMALGELLDLLLEHTRLEEVALFPVIAATGVAAGAVATLLADHSAVEHLAAELDGADDEAWPALAAELLAEVRAHIHREEHDVFPAAVRLVAAERWDEVHRVAAELSASQLPA